MITVCYICHTVFVPIKDNYSTRGQDIYITCPACLRRMDANLQKRSGIQQVIGFRDAQ